MKLNTTLEEVQKLTMEKFNLSKSDVSYITEDFLSEDFIDDDSSREFIVHGNKKIATGHNLAYARDSSGNFVYLFHSSRNEPCGNLKYAWLQNQWNLSRTGKYCGEFQDFQHEIIQFESV